MRPASAVQAVDCGALKHIEVKRRTKAWQRSHLQLPLLSQVLLLPFCPSVTERLTTHLAQALTQKRMNLCDLRFSF